MRKVAIALGVLVGVGVAVFPFYHEIGDGSLPLSVLVRSGGGKPIRSVSAAAFGNAEHAKETLEYLLPPETHNSATREPFDGKALVVDLWTSYHLRQALAWSSVQDYQPRKLVVIVQYADGKREGQMVDIPDLLRGREMVVEFP
jgi:hypothetical protein